MAWSYFSNCINCMKPDKKNNWDNYESSMHWFIESFTWGNNLGLMKSSR
jgi:hypothetical protein